MKVEGNPPPFDPKVFLARVGAGKTRVELRKRQIVFSQGDPADAVFYIQKGKIELRVLSQQGKEAILAILGVDDFFGEGCLAGQPLRMATAVAVTECSVVRVEKPAMIAVLHDEPVFSALFISYLLTRNIRIEEDLVDQLFNSSEKRLARLLLLLANFGKEGKPEAVIPKVSQEALAEMIGTTRSRVSFFMSRVEINGAAPVRVDWLLNPTNRGYKVTDLIVNGISMASAQHSDLVSVIQRNNGHVPALLAALREKNASNGILR